MADSQLIQRACRLLLEAAPPGSGVFLFGSHARGDARLDSDLDFLVVEPVVMNQHGEMVRLRDALRPLRVAADSGTPDATVGFHAQQAVEKSEDRAMQRIGIAATVVLALMAGCSTPVHTPGTKGLPSASVATLTASNHVGFRNYEGYAVDAIMIDGKSYTLTKDKTTFILTAGRHEVAFSYSKPPPMWNSAAETLCFFDAVAGGKYDLVSGYESAGLMHQIQTPDHTNVLKWKRNPVKDTPPAKD